MDIVDIERLFQSEKAQGVAIIGTDSELIESYAEDLLKWRSALTPTININVSTYVNAKVFHEALLKELFGAAQDVSFRIPSYILRMLDNSGSELEKFSILARSMSRKGYEVLVCLQNFHCVSTFYTSANASDYMHFRERDGSFALLLTSKHPLIEVEHSSIGHHLDSTLTHSVKEIRV